MKTTTFCMLALAIAFLSPGVSGQAPALPSTPEPPPAFGERVEVGLIEVEARVVDRDGRPVPGLTVADFELLVGGNVIAPTHFAEVSHLAAASSTTSQEVADSPKWLGLFLDLPTFEPAVVSRLVPWLEELAAASGARIALGTYRGPGSFHMNEVTPEAVRAELEKATTGLAASTSRELQRILNEIGQARRPESQADPRQADMAESEATAAWHSIEAYAQAMEQDYRFTADALEVFLSRLAGLPGTRTLLYIGEGRPLYPAQAPADAWERRFSTFNSRSQIASTLDGFHWKLGPISERLGNRAAELGIAFHSMGLDSSTHAGADMASQAIQTARIEEEGSRFHSLQMLAEPSGGRTFRQPTAAVLAEIRTELDHCYVLGFSPLASTKALAVEVRAKDPQLVVRHRRRALARSQRDRIVDRTLAALAFGQADNPLGARLDRSGIAEGKRGKPVELPVVVTVPMSRLALVARGAQHVGQITLFLAAADANGAASEVTEVRVPLRVPNEQLGQVLGQQAAYRTKLALKPGTPLVAATVVDDLSGAVATALLLLDAEAWASTE
jgi:VWFA-related protein